MRASQKFIAELQALNDQALSRIGTLAKTGISGRDSDEAISVPRLLKIALKNELEATEIAAIWLTDTPELDAKIALARQCGDEAKHFRMIQERLNALAIDTSTIDPRVGGYSPLFDYLKSLKSTIERVAAGQFTREALALVRNEAFIEFCEASGDPITASLYRDVIQPDEKHHHELGRRLLERYAVKPDDQQRARTAATKVLSMAEELQEIARLKGVVCPPGC